MNLQSLSDLELVAGYSEVIKELRRREIVRSHNVLGDLGEYMVISHYCNTKGLPKLQAAPPSTQNIDAISTKGERYSIKSTTGKTTGVFYGLNPKDSSIEQEKLFEHVIIAMFDHDFVLNRINELTWEDLLQNKKWHSRMNELNITINQKLLANTKTIYINNK
jgi:hypothetical protein